MPASASPSPTEQPTGRGETAVSEVVGFLLVFAILSIVLVLSMFAFNIIQERAEASVVVLEAESVAQRVAAAAVDAALFAERHDTATSEYTHPFELPETLEGHAYLIYLETEVLGVSPAGACNPCPSGPTCARPEQVRVCIADLALSTTAPLFSASAGANVNVCATTVAGGSMAVRFGPSPSPPTVRCIFLVTPS